MKKILCLLFVLVFLSFNSFAANLANKLTSTQLSKGVTGTYYSNASGTGNNDATNYVLSTGHKQGSKVYASGNFASEIYTKVASDPFVSSDLISSAPSTFDSAAFSGWTAL